MQKIDFSNGDFVIHKITLSEFAGKFSAWFRNDGSLKDAEQIDSLGRSRRCTQKQLQRLNTIGYVWK